MSGISKRRRWQLIVLCFCLLTTSAGAVSVPLPGLLGIYDSVGQSRSSAVHVQFDAPTFVESVSIRLSGFTICDVAPCDPPASFQAGGGSGPLDDVFEVELPQFFPTFLNPVPAGFVLGPGVSVSLGEVLSITGSASPFLDLDNPPDGATIVRADSSPAFVTNAVFEVAISVVPEPGAFVLMSAALLVLSRVAPRMQR